MPFVFFALFALFVRVESFRKKIINRSKIILLTPFTHTTHRTQQVNKVKGFNENAAQNLSNFSALNFFEFFYYFENKIVTSVNWSQLEPSQR